MPSGGLSLADVDGLRVVDLKEALKERGLPTDGKKVRACLRQLIAVLVFLPAADPFIYYGGAGASGSSKVVCFVSCSSFFVEDRFALPYLSSGQEIRASG